MPDGYEARYAGNVNHQILPPSPYRHPTPSEYRSFYTENIASYDNDSIDLRDSQ